jgi:VCBS repeat-containing protein
MRNRLFLVIVLTILLAVTLAGCGEASPTPSPLAVLSAAAGNVSVINGGTDSWTGAQIGISLDTGDGVRTGDSSSAGITFLDGSTLELQANTEIEIVSLEISTDTDTKTITLQQTIGTTISRVTKLLGTASSYAIETPTGVASVRGSILIVQILEGGTTLATNQEGDISFSWEGVELAIPEGQTCIGIPGQPPDLVPVAGDDSAVTDEDTPVTAAAPGVLDNDSDSDAGDTLTVIAVDTSGTVGSVTAWNADGSFTYDPNGQFEYLQTGSSTTDAFMYTVSDGRGGTDTATVTVTINGIDDPPVAANDGTTTDEDSPVAVVAPGVLINDSDPDVGDTLTVTSVDTSGTAGSVTVWNADGSFTYDPNGQFEYLQTGSSATDSFTYTVSDGKGGTDTATVTITIDGVNDPPVALNDSVTTSENTPVTIDVLNNDSDIDGGTLAVDSATQGANGSVTCNATAVTYTPAINFTGTDSFTYTISDGNGGTASATVTVTVAVPAQINVQIDTGPTASISIWDDTTDSWAIDQDTQEPVNGTHHVTSDVISVAAGHYYYVWVEEAGVTYNVKGCPHDWIITSAPQGDYEAAYGYAAADTVYPVHFTMK